MDWIWHQWKIFRAMCAWRARKCENRIAIPVHGQREFLRSFIRTFADQTKLCHWAAHFIFCVTAAYLSNRMPTRGSTKTPYEIWHKKTLNLRHLRVFGCSAMARVPKANWNSFDVKSMECIMLGYSETSKAYRLYDKTKRRATVSRDVAFIEPSCGKDEVIDKSKHLSNFFYLASDIALS